MRILFALLALLCSALPAFAGSLETIRKDGKFLWGGDEEGGGPFVYPRDDDANLVTGFEYDLANKLGEYLKVKAEFTQGQWDRQPDMLRTGKVHLIMNGYEYTPERLDVMDASIPYYVYALQLLARKGDPNVTSWEDFKKEQPGGAKLKVGVLTGSGAEEYMREEYGAFVEVVNYDGNTDSMREVETGKLDATLQDTPIASFYASSFPALAFVGEPVAPGYYVMYVQKGDTELQAALNEAIVLMARNGDLERIYRKYEIWDKAQAELIGIAEMGRFYGYDRAVSAEVVANTMPAEEVVRKSGRKRGLDVVTSYAGVMVESAGLTVLLSFLSFPLAIAVGLLVAVGRLYGPGWLKIPLAAYVELLRGTPLMLQLYFIFFLLPEVGVTIPAFACGVIGLAVNYSAYESEIYRAGLQAIPIGQMEAALSLGMSRARAIRRIIVPQAVRIVIPPVMNDFIALFKDTSVCSVITLVELTKRFSVLSMSTQATLELMGMTAALYLAMSYPMSLVSRRIERNLGTVMA